MTVSSQLRTLANGSFAAVNIFLGGPGPFNLSIYNMNLTRLSKRVRETNLFSSLGAELDDPSISRILSWEEWAGPEEPLVQVIHSHMQSLHDALVPEGSEQLWNEALHLTVEALSSLVPYIEDQDAWYAPNIAVWSAAWIFALEEAHIASEIPLPNDVCSQLYWFERGHWPCALVSLSSRDNIQDYVVY
ncbi:MAG TPA: hypothetical protein VIU46_06540 [Gallionellaceae bacterium]